MFSALEHTANFQLHNVSPRAMAEATAKQCFEYADVNHDGVLSFDEFKVGACSVSLPLCVSAIRNFQSHVRSFPNTRNKLHFTAASLSPYRPEPLAVVGRQQRREIMAPSSDGSRWVTSRTGKGS